MPSWEVDFRVDTSAPMTLLSRAPGAAVLRRVAQQPAARQSAALALHGQRHFPGIASTHGLAEPDGPAVREDVSQLLRIGRIGARLEQVVGGLAADPLRDDVADVVARALVDPKGHGPLIVSQRRSDVTLSISLQASITSSVPGKRNRTPSSATVK